MSPGSVGHEGVWGQVQWQQAAEVIRSTDCSLPGLSQQFSLFFPFSCRQLDKNQISCIEDGAFRALRGLEVL